MEIQGVQSDKTLIKNELINIWLKTFIWLKIASQRNVLDNYHYSHIIFKVASQRVTTSEPTSCNYQEILFQYKLDDLVTIREASKWASTYLKKKVTPSNISYLITYGKIKSYDNQLIKLSELKNYYDRHYSRRRKEWEKILGKDINWHLSFEEYREAERTKHVHRLHPYKGKFIPQLVEYFLNNKTDEYKKEVYFHPGDIILDPFCGSGTTLVQANELGIHAIGIDISFFNALISNVKVAKHDVAKLNRVIFDLTTKLKKFCCNRIYSEFDQILQAKLNEFNTKYFPTPEFKNKVKIHLIDETQYAIEKEKEFQEIYQQLINQYKIQVVQSRSETFLEKWYLQSIREELEFLKDEINKIDDLDVKNVLIIILSRTARSCRATTHSDLATLKTPVTKPYYCKKHSKICKPLFSILGWWERYAYDTLTRLKQFEQIRTNTFQTCLVGDSRTIDLYSEIRKINHKFASLLKEKKIKGIFSSPPYVGLIDYHEQHAYAYELFGFERRDGLEIGPLYKGQGEEARRSYIDGISSALINCRQYLQKNFDIFIVANDKFNLYPRIAELAGMKIVNEFKRPVLCRVEKDRETPFYESIFHLKNIKP